MCLGPSSGLALVGVWHTQEGTGCAAAKVLSPTSSPSILSVTLGIRCENPHVTDEGDGGSGAEEADKDLTVGQGPASVGWNPGEDPEPPSCITAPSPGRGIQDTSHSTTAQVYFCFPR